MADTVGEHFIPYYDQFMPSLKYIMANAIAKDHRLLRGRTIECISLIGLAVGEEKVSVLSSGHVAIHVNITCSSCKMLKML